MSEQLRVLLLINQLTIGGAELQLIELTRGLDRRRFYPIVCTLASNQPLEHELASEGVHLVSLERRERHDFAPLPKLIRLLKRERVHIIQTILSPATFFGLTASMAAGTPVKVGTEHSSGHLKPGPLVSRLYRFAEDRLTRFADVVVAVSEAGRGYLIARGIRSDKTRVIYNGVSPDRTVASQEQTLAVRRQLGLPANAQVIGIAARLAEAKDHETFLRAAAQVREALPSTYFVVMGDGPLRPRLEMLARQLGLASQVFFVGNQLEAGPFINCFDVAVLSSYAGESCSMFLLEAMAIGKPVVCTDVGGNREIVTDGENGFLVPTRAPEKLAQGLLSLLTDPARAKAMGEQAKRKFQERFTLERMVQEHERLYLELWSKYLKRAGSDSGQQVPLKTERTV